jgi:hypothetical protein
MENGIYPIETAGDSKEVSAAPVLKDILEIEGPYLACFYPSLFPPPPREFVQETPP